MDWEAIGAALGGLALGAAGVFGLWRRREVAQAKDQSEVAEHRSERARADAASQIADTERQLYAMLSARLSDLEGEVKMLRQELHTERQWARELEKHIYHLENTMREAGLTPPERQYVLGARA